MDRRVSELERMLETELVSRIASVELLVETLQHCRLTFLEVAQIWALLWRLVLALFLTRSIPNSRLLLLSVGAPLLR